MKKRLQNAAIIFMLASSSAHAGLFGTSVQGAFDTWRECAVEKKNPDSQCANQEKTILEVIKDKEEFVPTEGENKFLSKFKARALSEKLEGCKKIAGLYPDKEPSEKCKALTTIKQQVEQAKLQQAKPKEDVKSKILKTDPKMVSKSEEIIEAKKAAQEEKKEEQGFMSKQSYPIGEATLLHTSEKVTAAVRAYRICSEKVQEWGSEQCKGQETRVRNAIIETNDFAPVPHDPEWLNDQRKAATAITEQLCGFESHETPQCKKAHAASRVWKSEEK